jgi:GxxExxY protein
MTKWGRMTELLFRDEVYSIVSAAIEVHRILGHGFLEPVYQEALEIESRLRDLPFEAQKSLPIRYEEFPLRKE